MQLIPSDLIEAAKQRTPTYTSADPLIMSVDVARFGDDQSVIRFRKGLDAQSRPPIRKRGLDTMQLAGLCAEQINLHKPDAVFIDETGLGAGVVDRLRQLGYFVQGVNFASSADGDVGDFKVANKRAEIYCKAREWLKLGGALDQNDRELGEDLEGVQYFYDSNNAILLEKKDDMKKRGLRSPDDADAFCLTFAYPVAPKDMDEHGNPSHRVTDYDYDPFA